MRQQVRQQLSRFIARKRMTDDRNARRRTSPDLGVSRQARLVFSPAKHGLSWAQCQVAARLLARANQQRPLTGSPKRVQFLRSLRIAGILSSVKGNRVGNRRWGKRMMGKRAGKVMRDHALAHLRSYAPIAHLAAMVAKERREAQVYYETHGEPLPLGKEPAATQEEQHLRTIQDLWEAAQWQKQIDRLSGDAAPRSAAAAPATLRPPCRR